MERKRLKKIGFENTAELSNNLNSIDVFKFVMAIMVVAIHANPLFDCKNETVIKICSMIEDFAVPFFFISSGYLISRKFKEPFDCLENRKSVIKQLKRILKMYLIWTVIYFPLAIFDYHSKEYSLTYSLLVTVRKVIFRGDNYNSWMLWYLLSTIYALVFVWIAMKCKFKQKHLAVSTFVFFIVRFAVSKISVWESALPTVFEIIKKLIFYTITDGRIFSGVIYISIGILIYQKRNAAGIFKYLFIPALIGLFFIDNEIISGLLSVIKDTGLFVLIISIRMKDGNLYKYLRESSTIVYLIHMYVITFICYGIYGKMKDGVFVFVLAVIVSVALSFVYIAIKETYKKHRFRG